MLLSIIVHTHTWQCLIKVSKLFSNGSFRRSVRTEIWVGQLISIVGADSTHSGKLVKLVSNYFYKLQSLHIRYTSLKISAHRVASNCSKVFPSCRPYTSATPWFQLKRHLAAGFSNCLKAFPLSHMNYLRPCIHQMNRYRWIENVLLTHGYEKQIWWPWCYVFNKFASVHWIGVHFSCFEEEVSKPSSSFDWCANIQKVEPRLP